MLNSLKFKVFACFLFIILLGCSSNQGDNAQTAENKFSSLIPMVNVNNSLDVSVVGRENTFSIGSSIPISIVNQSVHYVTLNERSFTRIFVMQGTEWVEVENELSYSGTVVLAPHGTLLLDTSGSWVQPMLGDNFAISTKKIPLRILVIGEITENDVLTGRLIGAYIDVYLTL